MKRHEKEEEEEEEFLHVQTGSSSGAQTDHTLSYTYCFNMSDTEKESCTI